MQLATTQMQFNVPARVGADASRDRHEWPGVDRPFSRELDDAAARIDRPRPDAGPKPADVKDEKHAKPKARTSDTDAPDATKRSEDRKAIHDDSKSDEQGSTAADEQSPVVAADTRSGDTKADTKKAGDEVQAVDGQLAADLASDAVLDEDVDSGADTDADAVKDADAAAAPDAATLALAAVATATVQAPVTPTTNGQEGNASQVSSATNAPHPQTQSGKAHPQADPAPATPDPVAAATTPQAGTTDGDSTTSDDGDAASSNFTSQSHVTTADSKGASFDSAARLGASPSDASATSLPAPASSAGSAHSLTQTPAAPSPLTAGLTTAEGADADSPVNAARLTRGLQSVLSQQGGSVTLRLTPPELGTVRIQLQLSAGTVSASLHADGESARAMLTNQLSQLRTALENQGLTVERLNVQPMQQPGQSSLQQQNQQSTADGRSRGEYTGQQQHQQQEDDSRDGQQPSRDAFERLMLNQVA